MQQPPQHIAIIPDGNRRWARAHGVSVYQGHKRGLGSFETIADAAFQRGVRYFTFWGFSTENWSRSKHEVESLMKLFRWMFTTRVNDVHKKNIRLNVIGRVEGFSKDLQKMMRQAMALTRQNTGGVLSLALNYGGRAEIIDMVKKALKQKLAPNAVTEQSMQRLLYAPDLPDVDLIIRTSGEQRLSGFLSWEGVYSELFFSKRHWPDFTPKDLDHAFAEYRRRQRRFGG